MRLAPIIAAAALLPSIGTAADVPYRYDIGGRGCCLVIAHAGGAIEGNAYTNSEQAMLANLALGARVFEIDFSRTQDGVWVGTHDWQTWKLQAHWLGALPPAYADFAASRLRTPPGSIRTPYTPITLGFLEKMLALHKDLVIVTDTKYDLGELARALKATRLFRSLVPQAYSIEDVDMLRALGYERVILTVYKMELRHPDKVLNRIGEIVHQLHALTVPFDFFARQHARLAQLGAPVYVHGPPGSINSRELHHRFRRLGVAGFYLD